MCSDKNNPAFCPKVEITEKIEKIVFFLQQKQVIESKSGPGSD
jgi:hypothetical protein